MTSNDITISFGVDALLQNNIIQYLKNFTFNRKGELEKVQITNAHLHSKVVDGVLTPFIEIDSEIGSFDTSQVQIHFENNVHFMETANEIRFHTIKNMTSFLKPKPDSKPEN